MIFWIVWCVKICGDEDLWATDRKHRMNLSGSYHKGYSQHLQYLDSNKSSPKDLSPPLSEMVVGKLFSIGCCICHHFEEHQTIHHRRTLHAMPLVQAVTKVVAQPRANACKLHCVEHFLLHNQVSYKCDGTHATYCIVRRSMSICYTGSNRLVCALSFDSQLSCVFLLIKCIPIFSNVFPFFLFCW